MININHENAKGRDKADRPLITPFFYHFTELGSSHRPSFLSSSHRHER